jgi:maltooligosyltrehalose trehalohydrolase
MPALGAAVHGNTTTFRVWAPGHEQIDLVIESDADRLHAHPTTANADAGSTPSNHGPDIRPLTRDHCGYWSGTFDDVHAGALYRYRLEGDPDRVFPDPASRFQPSGVHGPSQVIDPSQFKWTDAAWTPPELDEMVFYELHVGTFTPAGTFQSAIDRLPYVKDLGVTAIELMPVGDFPGNRNWGYDGVAIYAPARCYGTPDDLRALVDAAHHHGLAVALDVVYNHLGPDGAYANAFSPFYFTDRHRSPWGLGVNLDGPHSAAVRAFFIANAIHWLREYHIDALRLDATHALQDDSPRHFLSELTTTVRDHAGRHVIVVAEDHRNLAQLASPVERGGFGLDAVWADDFHHQLRVHTAHDDESYYRDYSGTMIDLAATLQGGWFFTGQYSTHLRVPRGTDPSGLTPQQFVICIQNHDQIGNRADGARLNHHIDPAAYRAASALLLLAPQTPLLFMGQEWAATTPFLFFTDHHAELGRRITEGRRREFSAFAAFRETVDLTRIPDPQQPDTFERSRLRWDELEEPAHAGICRLYQRLLDVRRMMPRARRGSYEARALDAHTVALVFAADEANGDFVVVARLSGGAGEVTVPVETPGSLHVLLTTEDPHVVMDPIPPKLEADCALTIGFARPGAVVLGSRLAS